MYECVICHRKGKPLYKVDDELFCTECLLDSAKDVFRRCRTCGRMYRWLYDGECKRCFLRGMQDQRLAED